MTVDAVGREDFEGGGEGGLGEGVGVLREEERPGGVLRGAVLDDSLRDGEDVRVVEAGVQREPRWPDVPKADALRGDAGVGVVGVEGRDQPRDVDQAVGAGEMAGRVD